MGLFSGTMTYVRYRVVGGAKVTLPLLDEALGGFRARPITPKQLGQGESQENHAAQHTYEHRVAFTNLDDSGELWHVHECQIDQGVLLRLRVERRSVSKDLISLLYKQQLKQWEGPLSRLAKKQLRDDIHKSLLSRALPTISYIDAFWHLDKEQIYLFSQGKKARDLFESLFKSSFQEVLGCKLQVLDGLLPQEKSDGFKSLKPLAMQFAINP